MPARPHIRFGYVNRYLLAPLNAMESYMMTANRRTLLTSILT